MDEATKTPYVGATCACGATPPAYDHTPACRFEHFLCYSNVPDDHPLTEVMRVAYYHGTGKRGDMGRLRAPGNDLLAPFDALRQDAARLDWLDKCDLDKLHNTMSLVADGNPVRHVIDGALAVQRPVDVEPSNLRRHAERELDAIGEHSFARNALLAVVDLFASQGHSGSSAPWAIGMLERLLAFEPIAPLSGDDSEWMEVAEGLWQNVRCSHVFKSAADGAYDIDGRIFRDADGSCWTNHESRVPVVFPYTPRREYVEVPEQAVPHA